MFLIAKIVRGRRLLHELEAETEKETMQETTATDSSAMVFQPGRSDDSSQPKAGLSNTSMTPTSSRRKAIREKQDFSLSEGIKTDSDFDDFTMPYYLRRSSSMPSVSHSFIRPILKHYDYNSKLNRLQKRFLRFTWHRLQTKNGGKRVENVFEEIYERLLRQLPGTWKMFTTRTILSAMSRSETATLRDHAKETVKLIDYTIKILGVSEKERNDTGSDYDPFLIGKAHGRLRPYGFTGNYWEKLGEIIVDVVLSQEAVRDLPGASQAWVIFIACLVDQLRAGFDESKSGLMPITAIPSKKFSHSATSSENTADHHQHAYRPSDIACYPPCCISQPISPEYFPIMTLRGNTKQTFDSDRPQKTGRRNLPVPVTKCDSSTFQFQRKGSARLVTNRKRSEDHYTSFPSDNF